MRLIITIDVPDNVSVTVDTPPPAPVAAEPAKEAPKAPKSGKSSKMKKPEPTPAPKEDTPKEQKVYATVEDVTPLVRDYVTAHGVPALLKHLSFFEANRVSELTSENIPLLAASLQQDMVQ